MCPQYLWAVFLEIYTIDLTFCFNNGNYQMLTKNSFKDIQMKTLVIALLIISSFSAHASKRIQKIFENGSLLRNHVSLFLSDGEIVHFDQANHELLTKAKSALENSFFVEFERLSSRSTDTADIVTNITLLPELVRRSAPSTFTRPGNAPSVFSDLRLNLLDLDSRDPLYGANLTKFRTYNAAQRLMNTFNGDTDQESQCYNRAHMWTYEALVNERVNLGKVWIFFTKKYIREFQYKWWFHIAPYASVNDGNKKYVLDRGFTMAPYNFTNWKNIFMKNNANCPVVKDYRSYSNNEESEYCYLMYSNQFFWQPQHLKRLATQGRQQTRYNTSDLRITYENALKWRWNGRIPRMPSTPIPDRPTPDRPTPDRPTPDRPDSREWVRMGEQVISSNGVEGRVVGLLGNGYVNVQFVTARRPMSQLADTLAVRRGSVDGFSVGSAVWSTNNVPGIVSGFYKDGRIAVKFQGTREHLWQYSNMLRHRR